jgi:hypothetical protein
LAQVLLNMSGNLHAMPLLTLPLFWMLQAVCFDVDSTL